MFNSKKFDAEAEPAHVGGWDINVYLVDGESFECAVKEVPELLDGKLQFIDQEDGTTMIFNWRNVTAITATKR